MSVPNLRGRRKSGRRWCRAQRRAKIRGVLLPLPLTTSHGAIRDRLGRRVMLRGANLSGRHKWPPFLALDGPDALDRWAELGWNVMRLVIPWESIHPERARIDHAQLDRLAELARAAGARGIHVIADFHQDIYARAFGGSGAPSWSIAAEDRPSEAPPPDRFWFLRYATSEGVRRSLARLWTNADGVQDAFLEAVAALATRLGSEPAVIGIEPWNEPFPGDRPFEDFERDDLAPFLRRVVATARAAAPHWLAFVEGTVLASEHGTTLDVADLGNVVYIPHFYDKVVTTSQSFEGDHKELDAAIATFVRDAARMGVPWMLGEYGASRDTRGRVAYLSGHQVRLMACDAGSTAWHYAPSGDDEWNDEQMALDAPMLAVLTHPYATAVHGHDVRAQLDGGLALEWVSAGDDQPTEIALPDAWAGRAITSSAPVTRAGRRLSVVAPAGPAWVRIAGA